MDVVLGLFLGEKIFKRSNGEEVWRRGGQKFRLMENLGVRLSEAGKTAEAKSAFERFVEAFPEHPNTPAIKKRIEGL